MAIAALPRKELRAPVRENQKSSLLPGPCQRTSTRRALSGETSRAPYAGTNQGTPASSLRSPSAKAERESRSQASPQIQGTRASIEKNTRDHPTSGPRSGRKYPFAGGVNMSKSRGQNEGSIFQRRDVSTPEQKYISGPE